MSELDKTIARIKDVTERNRREAEEVRRISESKASLNKQYSVIIKSCQESAKDYEQLADWLTELESDRRLLGVIRSIVWDNSLYDGIKIDKLRRLLSVYEENEEEENRR